MHSTYLRFSRNIASTGVRRQRLLVCGERASDVITPCMPGPAIARFEMPVIDAQGCHQRTPISLRSNIKTSGAHRRVTMNTWYFAIG